MSKRRKRKNRNAPNISEAALKRARRQLNADEGTEEVIEEDSEESAAAARKAAEKRSERAARRASRRRSVPSGGLVSGEKKKNEQDTGLVASMLANPTIDVSPEELAEQYNYVINDLRNMGILALILLVVLIGLAQFI